MNEKQAIYRTNAYKKACQINGYSYSLNIIVFCLARNKTEKLYAVGKPFRFFDGRNKNLPRSKRYPKRLAGFMDWLELNGVSFAVECFSSTPSSLARLIFKGE